MFKNTSKFQLWARFVYTNAVMPLRVISYSDLAEGRNMED